MGHTAYSTSSAIAANRGVCIWATGYCCSLAFRSDTQTHQYPLSGTQWICCHPLANQGSPPSACLRAAQPHLVWPDNAMQEPPQEQHKCSLRAEESWEVHRSSANVHIIVHYSSLGAAPRSQRCQHGVLKNTITGERKHNCNQNNDYSHVHLNAEWEMNTEIFTWKWKVRN